MHQNLAAHVSSCTCARSTGTFAGSPDVLQQSAHAPELLAHAWEPPAHVPEFPAHAPEPAAQVPEPRAHAPSPGTCTGAPSTCNGGCFVGRGIFGRMMPRILFEGDAMTDGGVGGEGSVFGW